MPDPTAPVTADDLRDRYAEAMRVAFRQWINPDDDATNAPEVGEHFAHAARSVRDEEMERLRAELADRDDYRERYGNQMIAAAELIAERDELNAEVKQLRQHILDIDAHATPYEDLPDDPGYVGVYLLTSGALHRALGKVGHTSPKCQDATRVAELVEQLEQVERERGEQRQRAEQAEGKLDNAFKLLEKYRETTSMILGQRDALKAAIEQIDPRKLDLLADWFDHDDARKGGERNVTVQADLRRWAKVLAALDTPDTDPETPEESE